MRNVSNEELFDLVNEVLETNSGHCLDHSSVTKWLTLQILEKLDATRELNKRMLLDSSDEEYLVDEANVIPETISDWMKK